MGCSTFPSHLFPFLALQLVQHKSTLLSHSNSSVLLLCIYAMMMLLLMRLLCKQQRVRNDWFSMKIATMMMLLMITTTTTTASTECQENAWINAHHRHCTACTLHEDGNDDEEAVVADEKNESDTIQSQPASQPAQYLCIFALCYV